jgi:hypothetical protein
VFIQKRASVLMLLFNDLMLFGYHFRIKRCSVRHYLRLFVRGLMSYLRYLCLFAHSGVQHILRCAFLFCLFSSCVLCMQYCQFLWISHSWLSPSVFSNVNWYALSICDLGRSVTCFINMWSRPFSYKPRGNPGV